MHIEVYLHGNGCLLYMYVIEFYLNIAKIVLKI